MSNILETSITQITTAGSSAFSSIGSTLPVDSSVQVAVVGATACVVKVDYSNDGSTVVSSSPSYTVASGDETYTLALSTAYSYRRITVTGTITSVDATYLDNIQN